MCAEPIDAPTTRGVTAMNCMCEYQSPIGPITLASDGDSLTGLWLKNQKYYAHTLPQDTVKKRVPVLDQAMEWLDRYFAGEQPSATIPMAPAGSPFRQAVWQILRAIPYGETTTYREIAGKIATLYGRPSMSAQAVGGAVGHNQISIIIPCHRVLGSDGSLTGFAGGVDKKAWLLRLEKAERGVAAGRY